MAANKQASQALHWYRRDLRIADNVGLDEALKAHEIVWPVFVFDDAILQSADIGAPRVAFLLDCLESLRRNIDAAGGKLIIRHGKPEVELLRLAKETGATALYYNRDYEPFARERDARVTKAFEAEGLAVHGFKDGVLHEANEVLTKENKPYSVFSPYSRGWFPLPKDKPRAKAKFTLPAAKDIPASQELPSLPKLGFSLDIDLPRGGERAAREALTTFAKKPLLSYQDDRNFPAIEGTSRLSPHLRFGSVSPRTVFHEANKQREANPSADKQCHTFLSELCWREFYRQVLWHHPHVVEGAFKEKHDALEWENNEKWFEAWCEGRTGYPIVDAAMRQLNETGWMHNRLRMIVASFLTKDLLIDWKWGERYFMQRLVDGDLAANNGGWQWAAGTGTDAQPYFRIFNPSSQAEKFDPEGQFIQRFLPEVNSLDYPAPIVEHKAQREKALAMFKRLA